MIPLLVGTLFLSLSVGAYPLSLYKVADILKRVMFQGPQADIDASVLLSIRLPRVLFGAIAGAGLALGGVCMQTLFRNPLAEPGLMGLSSGAALAAATVSIFASQVPSLLANPFALPFAAFAGGLGITALVYRVSNQGGQLRVDAMLLMGIAMNALCGALIGLLLVIADDAQLRNITFWSFGSLGRADMKSTFVLACIMLFPIWGIWRQREAMNVLLMGEADAANMGVRVERLKFYLVTLSCLMVGLVVAMAGLIGFVGLVIPHIARLLFGVSHQTLVPASVLLGAMFLPLMDMLCRTAVAPAELPIGMMTSLMGAPFFIFLLLRKRAL
ncbi:iron ABC transporter permease [Kiritimatiellaeota bacterium B1221]|nr:iron ABC transporter permease [Kiritimatiellaeota bacterium B1221]